MYPPNYTRIIEIVWKIAPQAKIFIIYHIDIL